MTYACTYVNVAHWIVSGLLYWLVPYTYKYTLRVQNPHTFHNVDIATGRTCLRVIHSLTLGIKRSFITNQICWCIILRLYTCLHVKV